MQSLLVEITAFLRFLPSPPLDFFSFPRTHDSPETHLHPSRTPPTQRIHKGGSICIQLLASDSLNFLKDKPLRSRNSHDRAREGKVLAIVLSVPERAASKGRLKAPGTRLNGNWGIPERRAKTGALVSTESSSAGRANAGAGREGVDGGLRVDVRCLATHPFSQHPLWTRRHHQRRCHVTNTDYIYIYICRRFSLRQRGPRFSTLPRLLHSPFSFSFSFHGVPSFSLSLLRTVHSTQLRPLFRPPPPMLNHCPFSSVSRFPPVWDPVSFLFHFSTSSRRAGGSWTSITDGKANLEATGTVGKLGSKVLRNGSSANVAIFLNGM